MYRELKWFTVRLALEGVHEAEAAEEVQALQDELNMRPHLSNPQVSWQPETRRAIIQVDVEDLKPVPAAEQMTEELLEVAAGVLPGYEHLHVDILIVYPSKFGLNSTGPDKRAH